MSAEFTANQAIKSQYHAGLSMLQQSIENCPESLWFDPTAKNKYWQVAFHVLFYTHLYLQPSESVFVRWPKHRGESQSLGKPESVEPYTQADMLEYMAFCGEQVDQQVEVLDLAGESGFSWLPFNKLEVQLYNIRHIMQHTGELSGRLFEQEGIEINWVGMER